MGQPQSIIEMVPVIGTIYGVRRVGSREFRYIGLTTNSVKRRASEHWKTAARGKKTPFADWLRKHEDRSLVRFEIVESVMGDSLDAVGDAEVRWIAQLREDGHRLLNLTDGGLGPRGYVWTAEQRAAAGERSRGRKYPNPLRGERNPMWGRTHSDAQKARWSADRKGTNAGAANPNFGKFGAEHPAFGRVVSPETRRLLSEQKQGERNPNFGRTASDETRAKMSAVRRGRPQPSSVRSAHTRHHTKGVFSDTCRHCRADHGIEDQEGREG